VVEQSPSLGLPSPHAEHIVVPDAAKARAFLQDVLPEAEEQRLCRRPSDACPSELNASDASDDALPDAAADDCPSDRRVLPADADVEILADPELDVHLADGNPANWQLEPLVSAAVPNIPDAGPSAGRSIGESAGPELDARAALVHFVAGVAPLVLPEQEPEAERSAPELLAPPASLVQPESAALPPLLQEAELAPRCAALGAAAA
jgi:hypothetical protein